MNFQYLLEVTVCSAIFYILYHLIFRKTHFFNINRFYLLFGIVASLGIPLLNIPINSEFTRVIPEIINPSNIEVGNIRENSTPAVSNNIPYVSIIYFSGLIISILLFMTRLLNLVVARRKFKKGEVLNTKVLFTEGNFPTSSFFNQIYWNNNLEYSDEEARAILNHEISHIKNYHSIDIVIGHLYSSLLWFNPFSYLFTSALNQQHEFIADKEASQNVEIKKYTNLLINQIYSYSSLGIINRFSAKSVKNRINMLHFKSKSIMKKLSYLFIIPLLTGLIYLYGCTENDDQIIQPKSEIKSITVKDKEITLEFNDGNKTTMTAEKFKSVYGESDITIRETGKNKELEIRDDILLNVKFKSSDLFNYKLIKHETQGETYAYGAIIDKMGNPIRGAVILINGTSRGTVTNKHGVFMIRKPQDIEEFSFKVSVSNPEYENIKGVSIAF